MTSKYARNLGLAFVVILSTVLTGWLLAGTPAHEPPPPPSVWNRLTSGAQTLFRAKALDPTAEAVREAIRPTGALGWHQAGYRGKGIKIAILDSGFRGYRNALGKVLPSSIVARSFRKDGKLEARDSQHGILCGEVIHHLAPDAQLLFANWEPEHPSSYLDAVRWARRQGAQIISCSVIMPSWSDGDGGGATHNLLREILGSGDHQGDALLFASAGNTAQRHWTGSLAPNREGLHQWVKGKKDNPLRPFSHERVSIELTSPQAGYEVVLVDANTQQPIGRSRAQVSDGCASAIVRFEPKANQRYLVRVRWTTESSKPVGRFHLTVLGGRLQYTTAQGSVPFPGDGAEVVAVGAVDGRGRRLNYSSCGPCASSPKPDLVATVPFPSVWRPEQAFSGTSAAAPQAAALAALVWSRNPTWSANQVRETLGKAAYKVKAGHCPETGYGVVRLPK